MLVHFYPAWKQKVLNSTEISSSKVIIFSENKPQPLISSDVSMSPASLIYHGLESDTAQQVFWNVKPAVSKEGDVYVIALWGGVDAALDYVASIAQHKPHVLLIDDKTHDLRLLQEKGVMLDSEFEQKQTKPFQLMGKLSIEPSSFFDSCFLMANDQQVFLFQRMLKFLQDRELRFKSIESKLQWCYQTTLRTLTSNLRAQSIRDADGFAYDDTSIKRPFSFQYDADLADSAKQGIDSKRVQLPTQSFFKQNAPAILGSITLAVVLGVGIAFGLDLGLMLVLMAAITVTATYKQYQSGASTKAPHSLSMDR